MPESDAKLLYQIISSADATAADGRWTPAELLAVAVT
jgi:hypothetical protein